MFLTLMQVYPRFFLALSAITMFFLGNAQRFSGDKKEFSVQAINRLQAIGTEPAKKIAFDFSKAWNGKFTSNQQDKVYRIALRMQEKGYQFYPYFYHYFTYLAYTVTQENLQTDKLSRVLEVNEQVVETLSKSEYKEFLFGLNVFFARRYLSLDRNLAVQVPDGNYNFDLLDNYAKIQQEENRATIVDQERITAQKESALISDDSWDSSNDPWEGDSWGDSEDTWEDNSWSNLEHIRSDEFQDGDDSWGNDNGWESLSGSVEDLKASRPEYSPITIDYVTQKQSQYITPEKSGPVIELTNARLIISTPFDSLRIKNLEGSFLLKNRSLICTQGSIEWPATSKNFRGAIVQLEDFFVKKDRADFWTPHATLQFNEKITGEVAGVFEYNSMPRPKRTLNKYPIFTSHNADINVKLSDDKISYTGGIQLRGNKLFGRSVSRELGTLKILDGKGNTIILKSKEFVLGDSLMSMNNGSITIYHGNDSIYHESVQAKFDVMTKALRVLRNITAKPYRSSYFDVSLGVDLLTWNIGVDSISLEIMNGKDLLPATFESFNFLNDLRYRKVARSLDFHPINLAVHYALKYGVEEFYIGELTIEYEITENFAKAAGRVLSQYGFADYNIQTGLLRLYPEAFHYYNSSSRRVDFDNLMIPSKIKDGSNAYIQLDSGKLNIRGVSRFYITTDFKVYGLPHDGIVTLLKGRDIEFDGDVHAGDFDYQGKGHQFIYDEFLFNMPRIDSMKITVTFHDSTDTDRSFRKIELDNQITNTSGTLVVDDAQNKSNLIKNEKYPFFKADTEAVVYFNSTEILNGAYDKSVRFVIPPFELDSIEKRNGGSISFEGTFISGGIFPSFSETLKVQEDKSLGFKHQIPERGYGLYGTEAKTYEEIRLSNKGIRGYGQIDFLTTTIYSDDFIYYPDSVTTNGTSGIISPGTYKGASYPEAVFGTYDMYWLPRKDSMYLHTVGEPFKFYDATAELDGFANITTKGVYGGGTMLTRGSEATSKELNFKEFEYEAKHASFHILTQDSEKPAMAGDDIRLDFDLTTNTAVVRPEKSGVAAISFPYAQMKTSITEAVWDLEDSVVTMTKPSDIPIRDSYFFSTREELDSLAFNAERAIYDINSEELNIQGIPYIIVADSKIIPEGHETTIFANSELQEFTNAEIIIDTLNGYHYLDRANVKILSRNKFEGNAYYKQIVDKDTFDIRFDSFELREAPIKTPNKKGVYPTRLMTVSGGEVPESTKLRISPGFIYKGSVTMYAHKPALELDGYIQLDFKDRKSNMWVQFQRTEEERNVQLTVDDAEFETGQRVNVGIHKNVIDELYVTFIGLKEESFDADLFTASGVLSFNDSSETYIVETPSKTNGSSYAGSTMAYNEHTENIMFEGLVDFIDQSNSKIFLKASVLGSGNRESMELKADAMMALDIPSVPVSAIDEMAIDLMEIIERMGPPTANEISTEFLYKLANITSDRTAKEFEKTSLKGYIPLLNITTEIGRTLFISGVKMNWNQKHKAWHNTTKIGVSNINRADINAQLDGFLEIKKDETGEDIINIFFQAAPGVWYYLGYSANQLIMFSSNVKFNEIVQSKSNVDKARPSELILALGDENETLSFINHFRLNYFGIEEPYNLIFPDEMATEDETFDTIEEDDDDGFGFD
ncbi:MAG: hypothetical protein AAF620_10405 [Bacteroidota bacterium]